MTINYVVTFAIVFTWAIDHSPLPDQDLYVNGKFDIAFIKIYSACGPKNGRLLATVRKRKNNAINSSNYIEYHNVGYLTIFICNTVDIFDGTPFISGRYTATSVVHAIFGDFDRKPRSRGKFRVLSMRAIFGDVRVYWGGVKIWKITPPLFSPGFR